MRKENETAHQTGLVKIAVHFATTVRNIMRATKKVIKSVSQTGLVKTAKNFATE